MVCMKAKTTTTFLSLQLALQSTRQQGNTDNPRRSVKRARLIIIFLFFLLLASLIPDPSLREAQNTTNIQQPNNVLRLIDRHIPKTLIDSIQLSTPQRIFQLLTEPIKHVPAELQRLLHLFDVHV